MNSDFQSVKLHGASSESVETQSLVEVDVLEVRLPCRTFWIRYKVAETGEFLLTTEFLLRLSRLADGLQEDAVGEFFGFNPNETRFIVDFVESVGYVQRKNGRVYLTESGHGLFIGGDEPALFEVHAKQERFDFDLIAFAPADRRSLTQFEYELPELPLAESIEHAKASKHVFKSFARFFQEFRFKKGGSRLEKQSLYAIDDIQAEQRYSSTLPVSLMVRIDDPGFPETSFLRWRSGPELEDRAAIVQSCAELAKGVRFRQDQVSVHSKECLVSCAPEQLSRFVKNQKFDSGAFFHSTVRQAGELRIDRQTVRTVGHLWTDSNRVRFASALKYSVARSPKLPDLQLWVSSGVPCWGMTTRIQDILAAAARTFQTEDQDRGGLRAILIGRESIPTGFKHIFNAVIHVADCDLPEGLEIFLLPKHVAYVAIHTPIGHGEGYPVPIGILSFDPAVIDRVHDVVSKFIKDSYADPAYCDWSSDDIFAEIEAALVINAEERA